MGEYGVFLLGLIAGFCTTASMVPQVWKAWRTRDLTAISARMYVVLCAGFVLWIGYGFLIAAWPIVIFNSASLMFSGVILWLKWREGRGPKRQAAA